MATSSASRYSRRELLRQANTGLNAHLAGCVVTAPGFAEEGHLITDERTEEEEGLTWETQTDWEANQEAENVEIENGTVRLEENEFYVPESAVHRWWAGDITVNDGETPSTWPNAESNQDAYIGDNPGDPPVFRENKDGFDAVEFRRDGHGYTWDGSGNTPTGSSPHSIFILVWNPPQSHADGRNHAVSWGDNSGGEETAMRPSDDDETFRWVSWGDQVNAGSTPTEQWVTGGVSNTGTDQDVYLNGVNENSGTESMNIVDGGYALGWRNLPNYDSELGDDIFVAEVIISDQAEGDQAFQDYHDTRLA